MSDKRASGDEPYSDEKATGPSDSLIEMLLRANLRVLEQYDSYDARVLKNLITDAANSDFNASIDIGAMVCLCFQVIGKSKSPVSPRWRFSVGKHYWLLTDTLAKPRFSLLLALIEHFICCVQDSLSTDWGDLAGSNPLGNPDWLRLKRRSDRKGVVPGSVELKSWKITDQKPESGICEHQS
jgi:hypothetical protein